MRIDVISRSPVKTQAALKNGLPRTYVEISGTSEELGEPRNLVRAAVQAIIIGEAVGRRHSVTATKAIALLFAASLRAKSLGRWSETHDYDPRADLLKLEELARTKLGPARSRDRSVREFREGVADTLRILGEPPK